MLRSIFYVAIVCLAAAITGCGGEYYLTAPEQVGVAGGDAPVVIRLRKNDFFVLKLPVHGVAMRFGVADSPTRAAYTDNDGYAGAIVPLPDKPGRYNLFVQCMDKEGCEAGTNTSVYVLDKTKAAVAVDADSLDLGRSPKAAVAAVNKLAATASIIYMTNDDVSKHAAIHERLKAGGFPDGPILTWQRQRWHTVEGPYKVPQLVVEDKLVGILPELKKQMPLLETGVTGSELGAKAFVEAGIKRVMVVGVAKVGGLSVERTSWEAITGKGI